MTANTVTAEQSSASRGLGTLGTALFFLLVLVGVFFFYSHFFDSGYFGDDLWWHLGTIWLLVGVGIYVLFLLNPAKRRFWLFVYLIFVLTIAFGAFFQSQITGGTGVTRLIQNSPLLTSLFGGYFKSVIWSLVFGLLIALSLVIVPLLIIAFAASEYVLALHEIDGVRRRDAVSYVIALILGINQPFIVVEDGQALVTKEAGKINVIGGPGKLIIKQGNVVVLERGGKITRVLNAGVHKLKPLEKIRNVFNLGRQSNSDEIEHVLTKDRIPLKIKLGIGVQIEPASEADKRPESRISPDGEALTPRLDDGMYAVYEGTIRKAAQMSQATSFAKREFKKCDEEQVCQDVQETTWKKVAGGLPEGDLRDHIMSHRFDELFELVDSAPGEKPEIRVDKRKIYEIEQAILEKIKPGKLKGLGVLVHGVDIGKIEFPEEAKDLLLNRWGAPWQQQIQLIEAKAKAKGELQAKLLAAQGDLEATRMEAQGEREIADLKAQAIVISARAKAQKRVMEGRSQAEARAAFFQFIVEALQVDGRPIDPQLMGAILKELACSFASVNDLETFMRVHGRLNRQADFSLGQDNGTVASD